MSWAGLNLDLISDWATLKLEYSLLQQIKAMNGTGLLNVKRKNMNDKKCS
jgi:hypothetical protein